MESAATDIVSRSVGSGRKWAGKSHRNRLERAVLVDDMKNGNLEQWRVCVIYDFVKC